jgi:tetratricopeptide (TPR) repeat protein
LAFYYNNIGLCNYFIADPEALVIQSEEKEEENLLVKAIDMYDKAIELNEYEAVFYFNKANVLLTQKRFEEAHFYFDKAI